MSRLLILSTLMLSFAAPAFAAGTHKDSHGDEMAAGTPGKAGTVDRTVEVSMIETDDGEMLYEPRDLSFEKGETVRFIITNTGYGEHEFVLDSTDENQKHKALMEEFPEMEHADPNAIRLQPGESGEIVWTFTKAGAFEYACLIPGHYESGMHGPVSIGVGVAAN